MVIERSDKWYIPDKVVERRETVYPDYFDTYILAENEEEAIKKYKERYRCNDYNYVIDEYWTTNMFKYPCLNKNNPNFEYSVIATESYASFSKLKKKMAASEFLEYCKQEMCQLILNLEK